MSYLLGFDAGTTSFKCSLYNTAGVPVASGGIEYELLTPRPGFVEFPAEQYFIMFETLVRDVTAKSGVAPEDIAALAISSQGETLITLDGGGRPLGNAIVWLDNRSSLEAEEFKARFSPEVVYEATGQCEVVPTWTATKIMWLRKNAPETFREIRKFLLLEDYFIYMLTGRLVTERGLQCSSLLYDMRTGGWWEEALEFIGVPESRLPELADSGAPVGPVKKDAAARLGLSGGTLVVAGAMDQVCAMLGNGNVDAGGVSESTGSCLAVCVTADGKPRHDPAIRVTCQHHAIKGKYILMYWVQTAGMVYKWLKERFYAAESGAMAQHGADIFRFMDEEAAKAPPGADGLIMLPHLEGAQYPEFNSSAKGVLFGITLSHGRPEMARAALEAVAYTLNTILCDLRRAQGMHIPFVIACGGGAKSALWCEIKASVAGLPVRTSGVEQPASLGAAILAGVGAGVYGSVRQACAQIDREFKTYMPRAEWAAVYSEAYEKYRKLYTLLLPMYEA